MNPAQFVVLECFRPTDLMVPWQERRIRVPDSLEEFTKVTHLDVAHFTSSNVIPAIWMSGIQPGAGSARAINDGLFSEPDDVYLSSGVDKHYLKRAVKAHGGIGVAVVVRVPVSMLRADINILVPRGVKELGELEALHLSLVAGACSHRGKISPASILTVVDEAGSPFR